MELTQSIRDKSPLM